MTVPVPLPWTKLGFALRIPQPLVSSNERDSVVEVLPSLFGGILPASKNVPVDQHRHIHAHGLCQHPRRGVMHIEGHQRPGLLDELEEVSPKRLFVRHNVARGNVWLQLWLLGQVAAQNENSCVGFFNQLYEAGLSQGPVACPVIPFPTLVAVCYVILLLQTPGYERSACRESTKSVANVQQFTGMCIGDMTK